MAACANPIIGRWISTCIVNYQTSDRHHLLLLLLLRCCCCCCDSRIESSPRPFSTLSQQFLEKPSSLVRFSMKRDVRFNSIPGIVYYYFALFFYEKKKKIFSCCCHWRCRDTAEVRQSGLDANPNNINRQSDGRSKMSKEMLFGAVQS